MNIKISNFQEGEGKALIDISGHWRTKTGRIYRVTQLDKWFVWETIHKNGIAETGIGRFICKPSQHAVEAKWNFHGGSSHKKIHSCCGKVIKNKKGKAEKIKWDDHDHFIERLGRNIKKG